MGTNTLLASMGAMTALGLALVPAGPQGDASPMQGKPAPAFSASTSAGKSYSLKGLTANGPVYLYFIKKDCPTNARAEKYYNRIFEASGGKANFVGIINADAEEYKRWNNRFSPPFPVLLDPQKKIIHSYMAERSPWIVEVGSNGNVVKVWEGYSEPMLKELAKTMAGKATWPAVNFSGTPMDPTYG